MTVLLEKSKIPEGEAPQSSKLYILEHKFKLSQECSVALRY